MTRWTILPAVFMLAACSGGETKPDDQPDEATKVSLLEQCQKEAAVAKKQAELFANVTTGSRETMEAAYTDYRRVMERWDAEGSACQQDGASVTDRMVLQKDTSKALSDAYSTGTTKMIKFLEPNTDEARELLKMVFASGRAQNDDVFEAANAIDINYRKRLHATFLETKKYGQLRDELKTTCVFGPDKIDPNAEEITLNFRSNFRGRMTVHALCRIPLPAKEYGGDPDGQLVMVLDDDDDPSNGVLHEGKLGTPEEWKTTQWFSGTFQVPQGPTAQKDAGYYYVWIKAARPNMGDETLVHNWFYWHK